MKLQVKFPDGRKLLISPNVSDVREMGENEGRIDSNVIISHRLWTGDITHMPNRLIPKPPPAFITGSKKYREVKKKLGVRLYSKRGRNSHTTPYIMAKLCTWTHPRKRAYYANLPPSPPRPMPGGTVCGDEISPRHGRRQLLPSLYCPPTHDKDRTTHPHRTKYGPLTHRR